VNTIFIAIAVLITAVTIAALGWYLTNQELTALQQQHWAYVEKVRAEGELAAKQAKAREEEMGRIADETAKGWAAALGVVRADYARRLRNAASAGSGLVPGDTQAGPSAAGSDADTIPPPERVAADCAETTLTANYLQSYIEGLQK
jgi:hypothetical protein